MNKSKKLSLVLAVILVLVLAFYYYGKSGSPIDTEIRKAVGRLISIEGDLITLGSSPSSGEFSSDASLQQQFTFRINSETEWSRLVAKWPPWEELGISGYINLEDLPQEKGAGSLEDLKKYDSIEENIT